MPSEFYPGDGRHVGYCGTCGADIFNGPRHRCPKKLKRHVLELIMLAKQWRDARLRLMSQTVGGLPHHKSKRAEEAAFEAFSAAVRAHNELSTVREAKPE